MSEIMHERPGVYSNYDASAVVSAGQATKIIIPSDIQGIAGLASSLKEIVTDPKAETDK